MTKKNKNEEILFKRNNT